jgi:hypothetical protein
VFPVLVSGCGLGEGLNVRAHNNCLARHAEDAVVCEGPLQAYEVDPTIVQARSVGGAAAGYGYEEDVRSFSLPPAGSVHPSPTTVTLRPERVVSLAPQETR